MLWRWLGLIFVLSFGALGYLGWQIYLTAPPIPQTVVTTRRRRSLFTGEQIQRGQQAWLAAGGQQLGSVWGHGSYVAPDWSADWLHREATALQALRARSALRRSGGADGSRARRHRRARAARRCAATPTTPATARCTCRDRARRRRSASRASLRRPCSATTPSLAQAARPVRHDRRHACPRRPIARRWRPSSSGSSWAAATDRPGETDLSYTSNWPHEPLVGNTMTDSAAMWSMVSIILLLAGIAAMLWLHGAAKHEAAPQPPQADPLAGAVATPSMKATRKYFFVVIGLMLLQIGMGVDHGALRGRRPVVLRPAAGRGAALRREPHRAHAGRHLLDRHRLAGHRPLRRAAAVGREPKFQKLGVDVLF